LIQRKGLGLVINKPINSRHQKIHREHYYNANKENRQKCINDVHINGNKSNVFIALIFSLESQQMFAEIRQRS